MTEFIRSVLHDVRIAVRGLRASPAVTLAAIGCIALGIGATATLYTTAMAFSFRPLPQLHRPERLVVIGQSPERSPDPDGNLSPATYGALRTGLRTLTGVAVVQVGSASIRGVEEPERVLAVAANAEYFGVLGVPPALGRGFLPEDEREGSRVVVVSWPLWQRQLGGDPTAVGRTLVVNGETHTVVGVTPEGFNFPFGTELWQPLVLSPEAAADAEQRTLVAFARVAEGVSLAEVRSELAAVRAAQARLHPSAWDGWTLSSDWAEKVVGEGPRPFMISMLVGVAFVLLIACANVAMLLLAKTAGRQREIAIRLALGAGRGALLRQAFTESLVLALVGGGLGLVLSLWGVDLVVHSIPPELHGIIVGIGALRVDRSAVLFALLLSVASGLLFGLAPALEAGRLNLRDWLTQAGADSGSAPRADRIRSVLIVGQIALASALLVSALLMLHSVRQLADTDPGFAPGRMLTFRVSVPKQGFDEDPVRADFWERLEQRLREIPDAEHVGLVSVLPMSWNSHSQALAIEGRPAVREADALRLQFRSISADYFAALGLRPERGRGFEDVTATSPPVALLSVSAARKLFDTENPLGRRVRIGDRPEWVEIIGVVPDVRHNVLTSAEPQVAIYVPYVQRPLRATSVVVRTRGEDPYAAVPAARRAVAALDPRVAAGEVFSMGRVIEIASSPQRATAGTLFVIGMIAVLLAGLGVYGVITYFVARRTRELAIRRAMGARGAELLQHVLRRAVVLMGIGLVLGLSGAVVMGQGLRAILFETDPLDPLTYAGVAVTIALVVLLASIIPAARAAGADPAAVLRGEA